MRSVTARVLRFRNGTIYRRQGFKPSTAYPEDFRWENDSFSLNLYTYGHNNLIFNTDPTYCSIVAVAILASSLQYPWEAY